MRAPDSIWRMEHSEPSFFGTLARRAVAWIVLLVKAFSGARWEMPIAGPYAARLAARGVAAR